jgi:hypothetical protein
MTTKKEDSSFIVPSSPTDRKAIREKIIEISKLLIEIKDLNSAKKDFANDLFETYKVPKNLITKLAKAQMKHNFSEVTEEHSTFELIAEAIMTTTGPAPAAPTASGED